MNALEQALENAKKFTYRNILPPLAKVQQFLESPQPINPIPQVPKFVSNIPVVGGVANFAREVANYPLSFGAGTLSDISQNIGRLLSNREPAAYGNLKSPASRLGYNLAGSNVTPQQVLGNIAGTTLGPLSAYGGGKVFGLGKEAISGAATKSLKQLILEGMTTSGKFGLAFGGLSGLESGRQAPSLSGQLTQGGIGAGTGLAFGGTLGAAVPLGGAGVRKLTQTISEKLSKPPVTTLPAELYPLVNAARKANTFEEFSNSIKNLISNRKEEYQLPPEYLPARGQPTLKTGQMLYDLLQQKGFNKNKGTMSYVISTLKGESRDIKEFENLLGQPSTSKQWKALYALYKSRDYSMEGYKKLVGQLTASSKSVTEETTALHPKNFGFDSLENFYSNVKKGSLAALPPERTVQTPSLLERLRGLYQGTKRNVPEAVKESPLVRAQSKLEDMNLQSTVDSFEDMIRRSGTDVKSKVNLLDYARTPDRVLKKIGLGQEAEYLRKKWDDYLTELPVEINRITQWSKEVSPESNPRIFKYLDGADINLTEKELKVAKDIQEYLASWADRLNLPKDRRITNYITHIFERGKEGIEFDPDLAKLIREKIPGSVYDPFLQRRQGAPNYIEDTWQALQAYTKRAVRKANMDEALAKIKDVSENLETSQYEYVKKYIDRVNLRPTDWDNLFDNFIKSTPVGYRFGQRPFTVLTQAGRQWVYRGTLGLNPATALKNLTQGANTYAKLGEKYTLTGYAQALKSLMTGGDELQKVGVLKDEFIQDRTLSYTKRFWDKVDKVLFSFFDTAEKINRGAAYFGGKAKALAEGKSEQEAIGLGKKIVRDTQFLFGSIDTPQILQSDTGKTLLQFQSYTVKQTEFLGEMLAAKDFAGFARWALSSLAIITTVGKAFGMKPEDLVPTFRIGSSPLTQGPVNVYNAGIGAPDQYGNIPEGNIIERTGEALLKEMTPFIPAGVQIKKTLQGAKAISEGGVYSSYGNKLYEGPRNALEEAQALAFGPRNLSSGQAYRSVSEEMANFRKESTQDRKRVGREARSILNEMKGLTPAQQQVKLQNFRQSGRLTSDIYEKMKDLYKEDHLKITSADRQLQGLPVRNRSEYLLKKMKDENMTPDEQAEFLKEMRMKSIYTDKVKEEMLKIKGGR